MGCRKERRTTRTGSDVLAFTTFVTCNTTEESITSGTIGTFVSSRDQRDHNSTRGGSMLTVLGLGQSSLGFCFFMYWKE